jgi:signal transduction histidine kinase
VFPSELARAGLVPALRSMLVRDGAAPTLTVTGPAGLRLSPRVEAAVYFCCVEALHNASEHAGRGGRATLTAWSVNGELHFEVADDGVGFDQLEEQAGAGLTAMSDRISAIGGRLTIVSEPGHGTRVSGTIAVVP